MPFGPADPDTQAILDLIAGDPRHERDRAAVVYAIRSAAKAHAGQVNPNVVRRLIPTWVQPRVVGAVYHALAKADVIVHDGWEMSNDKHGRNSGRPVRAYRWVGGGCFVTAIADTETLTSAERSAFQQAEETIDNGRQAFVEVGEALALVRDQRLYREQYGTFEAYCQQRWDMSHRHVNRAIGAATLTREMGPIGPIAPRE